MNFYIVDAFTEKQFGGNPAGVVFLEKGQPFPSQELMVKTAAELRYSETAFVSQLDEAFFHLRYFTPAAEVDLCGHATIATFAALLDAGLVSADGQYTARTLAGDLNIRLQNGSIMMEMGAPRLLGEISAPGELERLYRIMGIPYEPAPIQIRGCRTELSPWVVSTGLPDIILPVKDRRTLSSLSPDFPALSRLSQDLQVTGVHAFTLDTESSDITAHCRNFAPLYGIDEEAATGTANGALTYYLYRLGLLKNGQECQFVQGEAMDRPSRIRSHLRVEKERPLIQVGGSAAILAKGQLLL
ncbi:PhzF family phenazine biosynthesis protein [bacterium 210820-DFI.6.37]|nr:PhzF family phenazine biosynthesis protein [bacterium 210820-DFI.6.37]